jgi:tRNA (cytidine/uridine-2'-O-)-methyltransferase
VLVRPLGFSTQNRWLKRAGLDYWEGVDVEEIDDLETVLKEDFFFFSSKAEKNYTEAPFKPGSTLIFGSETSGLPPYFKEKWPEKFFRIPMVEGARCLNLATSVGVVLYEALRQVQFRFPEKRERTKETTALTRTELVSGA